MEIGVMVELILDDCMNYMADLPDNAFELAIVDPPYFDGPNKPTIYRNSQFSGTLVPAGKYPEIKNWDVPAPEYFQELKRVSVNQIIWGANHFCDRYDASGPGWIVWDKDNGTSSFADCELASSSFDRAVRFFQYRWNGMLQGKHGDKRLNEKRIHPTQKPIALYKWLLANYAKQGDRILDTHLGSGSSAIAAHYAGYDFVGIEMDETYFQLARDRFDSETRQLAFL